MEKKDLSVLLIHTEAIIEVKDYLPSLKAIYNVASAVTRKQPFQQNILKRLSEKQVSIFKKTEKLFENFESLSPKEIKKINEKSCFNFWNFYWINPVFKHVDLYRNKKRLFSKLYISDL